MKTQKKALAVVLGGAFAVSLAVAPVVHAEQNPFAMKPLASGYMVADNQEGGEKMDEGKMKDGKCGTGKCGSSMKKKKAKAEEKAKEGSCSADKAKEGSCSGEKK